MGHVVSRWMTYLTLLVKRRRGDDWFCPVVEHITPTVEMALRDQLRRETQGERR